jgi:hypothetical protein
MNFLGRFGIALNDDHRRSDRSPADHRWPARVRHSACLLDGGAYGPIRATFQE